MNTKDLPVAVSGEDEAALRALAYAMESMSHKERIASIKAYGIDQRIDENDKAFAGLLPQTQTPDPGNEDPYIRVLADNAWAYKIDRDSSLKAQKEELQQ